MPDYRRNGYAYQLTVAMIRRLREEGKVPFVHIEEENEKIHESQPERGICKGSTNPLGENRKEPEGMTPFLTLRAGDYGS